MSDAKSKLNKEPEDGCRETRGTGPRPPAVEWGVSKQLGDFEAGEPDGRLAETTACRVG